MKRKALIGTAALAAAALTLSACGSDSSKTDSSKTNGGSAASGTVASKLIMGGPPEFQTRRLGQLTDTYGVTFKKFTALDTGGPQTITALKNGQVDAADIFTSDPAIKANNFVVLSDPKSMFGSQHVIPLINKSKATAGVTQVLNFIDAKMTSGVLIDLRTKVEVDKQDITKVAATFLTGLGQQPPATLNKGVSLTVGSANFPENTILGTIYAVALQATGATVKTQFNIGAREKYVPALQDGSIDLIPEYSGSILRYFDKNATATTEADVEAALKSKLPSKLTVLAAAPAQDNDAIVVTKATADKYSLTSIADLAKKG
jgi:osmoprotectant transport system substrate-binding protein